jgi:hypothetical protein
MPGGVRRGGGYASGTRNSGVLDAGLAGYRDEPNPVEDESGLRRFVGEVGFGMGYAAGQIVRFITCGKGRKRRIGSGEDEGWLI